ncbi:BQ5605_C007g04391 [Microbotryum silenes-dioicae]|uniref:BQ5605_C007g04384 protein n=1 Tax=Microbotryum silenes-dioicae TaxID=796604 RepID=A0A2X0MB00_9BASI|nr:BQ5605_C007g04384 [Microbotryum silenes-dioicae]SGY60194.1 BQ5605_C007g04391 [Microbotryum silenes-dioicae]
MNLSCLVMASSARARSQSLAINGSHTGHVTHFVCLTVMFGGHSSHTGGCTQLAIYPLVLGTLWAGHFKSSTRWADIDPMCRTFGLFNRDPVHSHLFSTSEEPLHQCSMSVHATPPSTSMTCELRFLRSTLAFYGLPQGHVNTFSPHRPFNFAIEMEDGKQYPSGPLYPLSEKGALRTFDFNRREPRQGPQGSMPPLSFRKRSTVAGATTSFEWKTAFRTRYGHATATRMPRYKIRSIRFD